MSEGFAVPVMTANERLVWAANYAIGREKRDPWTAAAAASATVLELRNMAAGSDLPRGTPPHDFVTACLREMSLWPEGGGQVVPDHG